MFGYVNTTPQSIDELLSNAVKRKDQNQGMLTQIQKALSNTGQMKLNQEVQPFSIDMSQQQQQQMDSQNRSIIVQDGSYLNNLSIDPQLELLIQQVNFLLSHQNQLQMQKYKQIQNSYPKIQKQSQQLQFLHQQQQTYLNQQIQLQKQQHQLQIQQKQLQDYQQNLQQYWLDAFCVNNGNRNININSSNLNNSSNNNNTNNNNNNSNNNNNNSNAQQPAQDDQQSNQLIQQIKLQLQQKCFQQQYLLEQLQQSQHFKDQKQIEQIQAAENDKDKALANEQIMQIQQQILNQTPKPYVQNLTPQPNPGEQNNDTQQPPQQTPNSLPKSTPDRSLKRKFVEGEGSKLKGTTLKFMKQKQPHSQFENSVDMTKLPQNERIERLHQLLQETDGPKFTGIPKFEAMSAEIERKFYQNKNMQHSGRYRVSRLSNSNLRLCNICKTEIHCEMDRKGFKYRICRTHRKAKIISENGKYYGKRFCTQCGSFKDIGLFCNDSHACIRHNRGKIKDKLIEKQTQYLEKFHDYVKDTGKLSEQLQKVRNEEVKEDAVTEEERNGDDINRQSDQMEVEGLGEEAGQPPDCQGMSQNGDTDHCPGEKENVVVNEQVQE